MYVITYCEHTFRRTFQLKWQSKCSDTRIPWQIVFIILYRMCRYIPSVIIKLRTCVMSCVQTWSGNSLKCFFFLCLKCIFIQLLFRAITYKKYYPAHIYADYEHITCPKYTFNIVNVKLGGLSYLSSIRWIHPLKDYFYSPPLCMCSALHTYNLCYIDSLLRWLRNKYNIFIIRPVAAQQPPITIL